MKDMHARTHTQTNDNPLLLHMLECFTKYMIVFYIRSTKFLTYIAQSKKTQDSLQCHKNTHKQSWEKRLALVNVP